MSKPQHHIPEALLLEYEVGALDEAVSLFVATHLSLCAHCRARLRELEVIAGAVLEEAPVDASGLDVEAGLEALIDRLDEALPIDPPTPPKPIHDENLARIPEPLRSYVPVDARGRIEWAVRMPGVGQIQLPLAHKGYGVVINVVSGGLSVPKHTHDGMEYNLVLSGGFTDRGRDFVRGDASVAGPDLVHELSIHRGEPCMLLAVMEKPLIPMSPLAKLLSKLLPV